MSLILLTLYVKMAFSISPADFIRKENLQWVNACAQRISDLKTQTVNYKFTQLCKKPNFYHSAKSNFLIRNSNHKISLNYKIRLNIQPASTSAEEAQKMLSLARSCTALIKSVWQRYGVEMNLIFDTDREPLVTDPQLPSRTIRFYNYEGRGNAENFYKIDDVNFCKVVSHEVGHHLGLPDEYEDLSCPDRSFISTEVSPYSVMGYMYYPWNELDFFSRHMKAVLSSFCTGVKTTDQSPPQGDWIDLGPPF